MIYLAADHRGFELKEKIKRWLKEWGYEYEDLGNEKLEPEDDYPDFAIKVAKKIRKGKAREKKDMGIVICGSGVGMDIVVNRFSGVRGGLGFSQQQVRLARRDDNINILALPADFITEQEARGIVRIFLETQFSQGEKYLRRLKKIDKIK